jgi:hypothetical protein
MPKAAGPGSHSARHVDGGPLTHQCTERRIAAPVCSRHDQRQTDQRAEYCDPVDLPERSGRQHDLPPRHPNHPGRAFRLATAPVQRRGGAHAARAVVVSRWSLQRRTRPLAAERLGEAHRQLRRRARAEAVRPLGSTRRQLQRRIRAGRQGPGDRAARRLAAKHRRGQARGVASAARQEPERVTVRRPPDRESARAWSRCGSAARGRSRRTSGRPHVRAPR